MLINPVWLHCNYTLIFLMSIKTGWYMLLHRPSHPFLVLTRWHLDPWYCVFEAVTESKVLNMKRENLDYHRWDLRTGSSVHVSVALVLLFYFEREPLDIRFKIKVSKISVWPRDKHRFLFCIGRTVFLDVTSTCSSCTLMTLGATD